LFEFADKDSGSSLDQKELHVVLDTVGIDISFNQCEIIIKNLAKTTKDGLVFEEFVHLICLLKGGVN
jgi:Ca2+-binding EF-hand superfamily protein